MIQQINQKKSNMLEIVLSAILALVVGGVTTAINNSNAKKREEDARLENFKLNEVAAENSDTRAREFYKDIQSPNAQLQALKDAGLSPSLMYSGSGVSGSGQATSTGAMGAGASGLLGNTFAMGTPRELAETRLANAQAKLAEQEAENINPESEFGQAHLNQIVAEINNKNANTKLTEMQKDLTEIGIELEKGNIKLVEMKTNEARNNANYLFWLAENSNLEWQFNKDTFEERKTMITKDLANKSVEYALMNSQVKLNTEEKAKLIAECESIYTKLFYYNDTDVANARAYQEWISTQSETLPEQLKVLQGQLKLANDKMWLDFSRGLFDTACHTAGMLFFGKKGGLKPIAPQNPVYTFNPKGTPSPNTWNMHKHETWWDY